MAVPWTETQVRKLLAELKNLPQAAAGHLLGAQVGFWLRQLDQSFRPNVLGDERLVDLLKRFPEVLTIEHDPRHSNDILVVFRETSPASSTDVLWQALVTPTPREGWFFDLATGEPAAIALDEDGRPTAGSGPAEEEHRYLEIPRVDRESLRGKLRDWVARSVADDEIRRQLSAILDQQSWYVSFGQACEASGQQGWDDIQRAAVAEHLVEWARTHGIKRASFLGNRKVRFPVAPKTRKVATEPPRPSRSDVRKIVERAIARMSDEELLELRIPLRYILD